MKVIVIGGHGTIGRKVSERLEEKHEVVRVGRSSGEFQVDISNEDSVSAMFQSIKNADAVVCIAGEAKWDKFQTMTEEDYYVGIKSKLMGQVHVARHAQRHLNTGGSITLTTGVLGDDPVSFTTSAAMVNGAINSFAKAAAMEIENGIRINVVSSGLVEDSALKYADYFPGHDPVPMSKVINAYIKCVEGKIQGQIVRVNA